MAYSKKPIYTEEAPTKGRSVVYYHGGHPWKAVGLYGTTDQSDDSFIPVGITSYAFDRMDPDRKRRYTYVDHAQHLLWFAVETAKSGENVYEVKATNKHRKEMEVLQRAYIVRSNGELIPRQAALQQEVDLRDLGIA